MKIQPILICIIVVIAMNCAKETSCEGCYHPSNPLPDTTLNELITKCDISIEDESLVRKIYPQVKTKKWIGSYWIFDSILMDGSKRYIRTYDLKNYLPMNEYKKGDTFIVNYGIRWIGRMSEYVDDDTLVY